MEDVIDQGAVQEAYKAGCETAKRWDKPWTPGGPFHRAPTHFDRGAMRAWCVQSTANHAAWCKGFRDTYKPDA